MSPNTDLIAHTTSLALRVEPQETGQTQEMEFHPLSRLFPLMSDKELKALARDIQAHGQLERITTYEGMILEGRGRYRACRLTGVEPRFEDYGGDDPLAFVLAKNLTRRHLNESQRAMVAARFANMRQGERTDLQPSADLRKVSQPRAAHLLNVAARSVTSAKKVLDKGAPELVKAVEDGDVAVSVAEQIADYPHEKQKELLNHKRPHTAVKKQRRAIRELEVAANIKALPKKSYGLVLADPPWKLEPLSETNSPTVEDHYPTQQIDQICALDVASIAADDCVLFLWTTVSMLLNALKVMQAWGFAYRSHVVWHKDKMFLGYWFRNAHEILLVGVKGKPPAPPMGQRWDSVLFAKVRKHSEKPEVFYKMIEEYYPFLPKIELHARGPARKGWDVWGPESQPDESSAPGDGADTDSGTGTGNEAETESEPDQQSAAEDGADTDSGSSETETGNKAQPEC